MINPQIENYIRDARSKNATDEAIKAALIQAGWPEAEVLKDIEEIRVGSGGMPLAPAPHNMSSVSHTSESKFGMWITFEYVLFFISLATVASSLAGILHYFVDFYLKDSILVYEYGVRSFTNSMITGYEAALIVAFPIFAVLAAVLLRQYKTNPEVGDIRIRKNLVYVALIWTFVAMLVRIIKIVYDFLGGAAGGNSLMHLIVTLLTAGPIFVYFLLDVRKDRKLQ